MILPNIRLHTNQLVSNEITTRNGLPVTTVARTLADVSNRGLATELVRQAVQESLQRGLVSRADIQNQAKRSRGRAKELLQELILENPPNEI